MKHVVPSLLVLAVTAAIVAALAPLAAGDAIYHTEHLDLTPVGDATLRSGFVQNIKANGPQIYAHELYVLNGAAASATYTVTRRFFFQDPRVRREPGLFERPRPPSTRTLPATRRLTSSSPRLKQQGSRAFTA